jgi:hypothetical protein
MGPYRENPVNLAITGLLTCVDRIIETIDRLFIEPDTRFVICDLLHSPLVLNKRALLDRRVYSEYVAVIAFPSRRKSVWVIPSAIYAYDHTFHGTVGHDGLGARGGG